MSCTVIDHTPYHFQNVSKYLFTTCTVYARNMRCLFMQYAPHIHRTTLSIKPTYNANKAKQKHPIWEQQTLDLQGISSGNANNQYWLYKLQPVFQCRMFSCIDLFQSKCDKVVWSQYRDSQCYLAITSDIYRVNLF
jgi:hypothetical protein